jgi:hypothetical protein
MVDMYGVYIPGSRIFSRSLIAVFTALISVCNAAAAGDVVDSAAAAAVVVIVVVSVDASLACTFAFACSTDNCLSSCIKRRTYGCENDDE